jgi:hypothetical protein
MVAVELSDWAWPGIERRWSGTARLQVAGVFISRAAAEWHAAAAVAASDFLLAGAAVCCTVLTGKKNVNTKFWIIFMFFVFVSTVAAAVFLCFIFYRCCGYAMSCPEMTIVS